MTTRTAKHPASLTTGTGYWATAELDEPHVPPLRLADGPHGLRIQDDDNPDHLGLGRSRPATCFPPAVTLASSWDPELVAAIGAALGREAAAAGVDVVLGPGVNIKRSPLCGRNFEYFSEDPLLTGELGGAMVEGIQSQGVAACVKHFAANNQETDRLRVSVEIDERTLREIYLRAFQITLRDRPVWAVMSAYNRINGVYASENRRLLTDTLRDEWGFDGVVISDWGAVHDPVSALEAGLDLRMPGQPDDRRIHSALEAGRIPGSAIDDVVDRMSLLAQRTRRESVSAVDHAEHHELTRRAAGESAVLLQNDGVLPLRLGSSTRIAVIGELATNPRLQGAGSSAVHPTRVDTAWNILQKEVGAVGGTISYSPGYDLDGGAADPAELAATRALVSRSDVCLLFLGLPAASETEGRDRSSIDLPENQLSLVAELSTLDVPIVAVLSNGSVVRTSSWRHHVQAVVEFWLTGQAHGLAIADVLTGAVNPSGKLAETIPLRLEDTPSYLAFPGESGSVRYSEGVYVGYRYFDAKAMEVDFPFGHGLSYTTFGYSDLQVDVGDRHDEVACTVRLIVTNEGPCAGAEVVQVYFAEHSAQVSTPPQQLRGFTKVRLEFGQSAEVEIPIRRADLGYFSERSGRWVFEGGVVGINVGSSSRDIRLSAEVALEGETLRQPLSIWSTWGELRADEGAAAALDAAITRGGGLRGRVADLIVDEIGRQSVLELPLQTLVEFPGFPVSRDDVEAIIDRVESCEARESE
ncbi:glycoside hydrolase family 3 C-terminal domain-containing protein [Microbacterium aoyamense]|uniref:Glycoside hydrolase family 3 C-terminal domain-containing protein n=1 Tax=Microbacterium aoyamense TaxID=344166 RepID=A0ABN2PD88_9MICO|nr:glycoside hydrolase family 3 N-terminal domain-containing protein [Microbacterium aoyamense]